MGSRLFDRLPDGYEMTAQGEQLRNQLRGVSEQIESAQRSLSGRDLSLSGAIRITTTDTLIRGLLMPYLAEFHDLNPATQMEIVINNTFLSLTRREADVAVRPSENICSRKSGGEARRASSDRDLRLKGLSEEERERERMGCARLGGARGNAVAPGPSEMDAREHS